MQTIPAWQHDEMKHAGVDYSDVEQVAVYDANHRRFRDYEKGAQAILEVLDIQPEHTVIDLGVGTGAFALYAARHCKRVYAVDVSKAMLDYTQQQAEQMSLTNIEFCHGGFLTYEHQAKPVDAVVSVAVLHHLPDFWKQVGLKRVARMLKQGGKFHLFDVVFPADMEDHAPHFNAMVTSLTERVGDDFGREAETHLRDEYSTYDWMMEGMLQRAGFRIERAHYSETLSATYLCIKQEETHP